MISLGIGSDIKKPLSRWGNDSGASFLLTECDYEVLLSILSVVLNSDFCIDFLAD